jgi:hypothetical protein
MSFQIANDPSTVVPDCSSYHGTHRRPVGSVAGHPQSMPMTCEPCPEHPERNAVWPATLHALQFGCIPPLESRDNRGESPPFVPGLLESQRINRLGDLDCMAKVCQCYPGTNPQPMPSGIRYHYASQSFTNECSVR